MLSVIKTMDLFCKPNPHTCTTSFKPGSMVINNELSKVLEHLYLPESCIVLDDNIIQQLTLFPEDTTTFLTNWYKLHHGKTIFIPIVHNGHWILLVIDDEKKICTYYNSIGPQLDKQITANIIRILHIFDYTLPMTRQIRCALVNHQQKFFSNDCGIFVVLNIIQEIIAIADSHALSNMMIPVLNDLYNNTAHVRQILDLLV